MKICNSKKCGICGAIVENVPKNHFDMPVCDNCLNGDVEEELLDKDSINNVYWNRALKFLVVDLGDMSKLQKELCEICIRLTCLEAKIEFDRSKDKYTMYASEEEHTKLLQLLGDSINYIVEKFE